MTSTQVEDLPYTDITMKRKLGTSFKDVDTGSTPVEDSPVRHTEHDERILWNFAMETTAHGVSKVVSAKSAIKRAFWLIALIGAFVLSAVMITLRFQAYFSYNTVVEFNTIFPWNLHFPAVTLCNFNKVRLSYLHEGDNAKIFGVLNDLLTEEFTGREDNICDCSSDEFRCLTAQAQTNKTCCIPISWTCDGSVDCFDGSDEGDVCIASLMDGIFSSRPIISGDVYPICSSPSSDSGFADSGWVTSTDFGVKLYDNSVSCSANLPHRNFNYIIMSIYAEIESDYSCIYDYLEIGSVKICGEYEQTVAVDVESMNQGATVPIKFSSDSSVTKLGFALKYHYADTADTEDGGSYTILSSISAPTTVGSSGYEIDERFFYLQNVSQAIHICNPELQEYPLLSHTGVNSLGTWVLLSSESYMNGSDDVHYPVGVRCTVQFIPEEGALPEIRFTELALDGVHSENCSTDYILIEYLNHYGNLTQLPFCGMYNQPVDLTDYYLGSIDVSFITSISTPPDKRIGFSMILAGGNDTADSYGDSGSIEDTTPMLQTTEANTGGQLVKRKKRSEPINVYNMIRNRRSTNTTQKSGAAQALDLAGTRFSDRIKDGGWNLTNSILHCKYRGKQCDQYWFKHIFTKFGNCYTFNPDGLLTRNMTDPLEVPLTQLQPGPTHGLNLKLDIHREEYSENLETGYSEVGIKFQVHSSSTSPDVENQGLAVSTGKHVYAGFKLTKVKNIEPPWGRCSRSITLKYSERYSYEQCAVECKTRYTFDRCGCKPYYYPGHDIPECNAFDLKTCALPAIARLDQGEFSRECECPVSCEYDTIDMKTSYIEFGSIPAVVDEMNEEYFNITDQDKNPRNDSSFYKNNVISFSVYYDELSYGEMRQLKAMDESSLLSDLGGQLGLFIGVSVLTICEMFEALVLAITQCSRRRKARKIAEKWLGMANERQSNKK